MTELDRTEQNPSEVLVTPTNFDLLSWNNYENVILSSCLSSLRAEKLAHSKETVNTLSFWDNLLFSNFQLCLNQLPNLQNLTLLNVIIDESTNTNEPPRITETIEVPNLKNLAIIRDPNVQKDDYFLLDYLTRGVTLSNLEKLEFRGEDNFNMYSVRLPSHEEALENWAHIIEPTVLAKFLIKNRSSLKTLELRGPGVVVFSTLTEDIQDLPAVQAENYRYSMDNDGANYVLSQQNRLQSLTCEDYVYSFNMDKMSALSSSIIRNALTLTSIQIFPNVLYNNELTEEMLALTTIDCRSFEQCLNLEKLQLNLELMNQRKDWESTKSGLVTNIAFLPHSLRQLNIMSDRFSEADIEAFGYQLNDFQELEYICLETSSSNVFTFKFEWIEVLYNLPQMKRILFNGARIDDLPAALDFIGSRPDARGSMINDEELSILLRIQ